MRDPVEAYLHKVAAQLGAMPADERAELLVEIRSHIEAMVAAEKAAGAVADEAVRASLARFGEADRVGRELSRSRCGMSRGRAAAVGALIFGAVFLVNAAGGLYGYHAQHLGFMPELWRALSLSFFAWLTLVGPLCGGLAAGWLLRDRAIQATLVGFLVWTAPFVLWLYHGSTDEGEWWVVLCVLLLLGLPAALVAADWGKSRALRQTC